MSKKYEPGDIATFYFIITSFDNHKEIQAWTDSKDLAKAYMHFHKCKKFELKVTTKPIDEVSEILEENLHDEIGIYNILIKGDKSGKCRDINIPATYTEVMFINEETTTYMASQIDYSSINDLFPLLKDKYKKALNDMLLVDVMSKVIHNKSSMILKDVEFDQLLVLSRSFPENFGI